MGSMSMPNAAPLPRLGEVFFDVRSASRSLRISWYAGTGVAVLSIWQGGICTGSFRLPMGDLPRMIAALQRGPDGQAAAGGKYASPAAPGHAPPGAGDYSADGRQDARADAGAATSYDPYPAGPGSLHYLNGSGAGPSPDETGAVYPDSPAPAHYPVSPVPAHYPDETGAVYPDSPASPHYPVSPAPAHYPDETGAVYPDDSAWPGGRDAPMPSRYPDEAGPADYPVGTGRRDFPADPPGDLYPAGPYPAGPYPAGTESPDHSPRPTGIDRPQPPVSGSPYGPAQPGMTAPERAPGPGSMPVAPADDRLDPLPGSFPHGAPRHGHRRHKQQSRPLRPFD
jgi:hypothetical protein